VFKILADKTRAAVSLNEQCMFLIKLFKIEIVSPFLSSILLLDSKFSVISL